MGKTKLTRQEKAIEEGLLNSNRGQVSWYRKVFYTFLYHEKA